jgi:hypothetical protein
MKIRDVDAVWRIINQLKLACVAPEDLRRLTEGS